MKSLLISILLLATTAVFAQDPDKTVTLKASGSGTTQEQAKNNALRSAVEQAYGAFISSKTEILNDQVVADEIVSVASGNIQAFKILEEQHTDSLDFCLLEAAVSISKLTSFAQSKGYAVEVQGGMFAINIKQKQLNESAEVVAIRNGLTTALDILDNGFDFKIKTSEPVVNDAIKGDWKMVVDVETYTNENYVSAHKIVHSLLNSISMNEQEVAEYKTLGKTVYQLNYHFPDQTLKPYYLRSSDGLWAFIRYTFKIPNLTQRFKITDGIKDYKNGVQLDYENISNITFQESLSAMVQQYNNLKNDGLNREWTHPELLQQHYDLQKKINPLKSEDDIYGYYKKRNLFYNNDSYFEFFPKVCVQKLDFFEVSICKAANCSLTFIYSLQEIEKINEIKATPLEANKNPLNKGLFQMIDFFECSDNNSMINVPEKKNRPFIFNEPLTLIDNPNSSSDIAIQRIVGDRYVNNLLNNGVGVNNNFLTSKLESHYSSIAFQNLRKGIYEISIGYFSEVNGDVTIESARVDFFEKKNPKQFIQVIEAKGGYPINKDNPMLSLWQSFKTPINDVETQYLSKYIFGTANEIHNHPIAVTKDGCSRCPPTKVRRHYNVVYTLYVN